MNTNNLTMVTVSRAQFKNCGALGTTNKREAVCPCCGKVVKPFEGEQYGISRNKNGVTLHPWCIGSNAVGDLVRGSYSKRCVNHRIVATLHCKAADVEAVWVDLVASYGVACFRQGCLLHIVSPLYTSNQPSSNLFELLSDIGIKVNLLVGSTEYKDVDAVTYKRLTDRKAPRF